jgi:hypothetical protein
MAGAVDTAKGALKSVYNNFSKVATVGGLLLLPFFGAAAAAYGAAHAATASAGGYLGSFWSTLVTNHATGQLTVAGGLKDIFNGWAMLGKSAYSVASAAWDPTRTMAQALSSPLSFAPVLGA